MKFVTYLSKTKYTSVKCYIYLAKNAKNVGSVNTKIEGRPQLRFRYPLDIHNLHKIC